MRNPLKKEVKGKGQPGIISVLGTISRNQKKQQENHQITGIKITRKQVSQEVSGAERFLRPSPIP